MRIARRPGRRAIGCALAAGRRWPTRRKNGAAGDATRPCDAADSRPPRHCLARPTVRYGPPKARPVPVPARLPAHGQCSSLRAHPQAQPFAAVTPRPPAAARPVSLLHPHDAQRDCRGKKRPSFPPTSEEALNIDAGSMLTHYQRREGEPGPQSTDGGQDRRWQTRTKTT